MILKSMILDTFKGVTHGEYTFSQLTSILGKNGSGKTTIADAWYWVFCDKDYDVQSNPEVHPDFMVESEPSVTLICEIDGKEVKLRKYQTDMRTKKQKEANAPVRISNKYEINDVPKNQKDFFKDIESRFIDIDDFLLLSHPEIFTSQKSAECRKILFGMVSDVTDADVAKTIPECVNLAEKMNDYTLEELTAMNKATMKRCKEQLDALPNQIIGMEKSKVEVDKTLPDRIKAIEAEIADATEKRDSLTKKGDVSNINGRVRELLNRKSEMYNNANAERIEKYRQLREEFDFMTDNYNDAKRELFRIENSGKNINDMFKTATEKYKSLNAELNDVKAKKFTARKNCPTCGQMIPKGELEKAKAQWTEQRNVEIKDIEDRMRAVKTQCDSYKTEGKSLAEKKAEAEAKVNDLRTVLMDKQKEIAKIEEPINPNYDEIDMEIASLNAERQKADDYIKQAYTIDDDIKAKKASLQSLIRQLASEDNNAFIDERIEEARQAQKQYAQQKADAESILYQIQLVSQKKNELLSEQVNSHFTRVKFRLFQTQKNGEVKDDCTPMVLCPDGEYRDMTYSANTASIVLAKLDICAGLQKYYDQNLPIWLDGAECLDEKNRGALKMDNQLMLLCVTEDERLVVR